MAIPLKRAKRRAQRARRRAHQHAPQADRVVWDGTRQLALSWRLRIDTRPNSAANAVHRMGDVGVATATALQGLHAAIDRDRLAARIAATSLLSRTNSTRAPCSRWIRSARASFAGAIAVV